MAAMKIVALALLLAAASAAAEPAIWVVRDADTEITLFGTLHELPTGVDWLSPRIAARLDAADTLVLETTLPEDRSAFTELVTTLGYSPKLPPLARRIAPRLQAPLAAVVRDTRLPSAALDKMETWLAAVTLGDAVLGKLGLDEANGVEAVLTARARGARKPVAGLETPVQQLGYFDTLRETDQRALLDATVADTATASADTKQLIAAWTNGNTQGIADAFRDSLRATPGLAQVLLVDRNARWAAWIAARLAQPGKVFVAVGAAHLAGADSVQAKLAVQGIAAERLR